MFVAKRQESCLRKSAEERLERITERFFDPLNMAEGWMPQGQVSDNWWLMEEVRLAVCAEPMELTFFCI